MSNRSKTVKHLKDVGADFNRDLIPELYNQMSGDYEPVIIGGRPDFANSDFKFPSVAADALATDTVSLPRYAERLTDLGAVNNRVPELKQVDYTKRHVTDWEYLTPRQKQDALVNMMELWFDLATLGEGLALKAGPKLVGAAGRRTEAGMSRLADYVLHPKILKTRGVRGGKIGTETTSIPPQLKNGEWLKGTTPSKTPDIDAARWPFKEIKTGGLRKVAPVPPKKYTGDFDWRVYTGWDDAPELMKKGARLRDIGPTSVELLDRYGF